MEKEQFVAVEAEPWWLLDTPATEEPVVSAPSAAASASATATREAWPHRSAFGSRAEAPSGDPGNGASTASTSAAPSRRSAFGGTAADDGPGRPAGEGTATIAERIETVMSARSSDELSSVASELGVSAEDVQAMTSDPKFASGSPKRVPAWTGWTPSPNTPTRRAALDPNRQLPICPSTAPGRLP
jgi:hypothetical protein